MQPQDTVPSAENVIASNSKTAADPIGLACLTCRKKHLKCDGASPCRRCLKLNIECAYTPSRRGYQGPSKKRRLSNSDCQPSPSTSEHQSQRGGSKTPVEAVQGQQWWPVPLSNAGHDGFSSDLTGWRATRADGGDTLWLPKDVVDTTKGSNDPYVDSYYKNFHPAHPVLPPQAVVLRDSMTTTIPLQAVVKLIGAHYLGSSSCDDYKNDTLAAFSYDATSTAGNVQARLLFAVVLHVRNEQSEALSSLNTAIDMALALGMNKATFARTMAGDDAVIQESLRRTWWEMHVLSCMFAGLHQDISLFKTNNVPSDVGLPCEDDAYRTGIIPHPPSMDDFHDRAFMDDDVEFSSYCYRIEAVQLLGRVVSLRSNSPAENVDSLDAALAGWSHNLPDTKKEVVGRSGKVDELMFQANMFIASALIYLHLPRSQLLSAPINTTTAGMTCAKRAQVSAPALSQHTHAVKCIRAAHKLSALAALEMPVQCHTPLFVCGIVLDAIVQLAACSIQACDCIEQHRDRITLAVGILKSLSKTWPIAHRAMQQVKGVARSVLAIGVRPARPAIADSVDEIDIASIINEDMFLGLASDMEQASQFLGMEMAHG